MNARSRTSLAAFGVTAALVLAACGSSSGTTSYGGGSPKTTATATTDGAATGSSSNKAPVDLGGTVNDEGGTKDISSKGATAAVSIELEDNYFSPTYVKAAPGATVTVSLSNTGARPHTFTTDDGKVDQTVEPGKKATVMVTVPKSGALPFACNFHGSMGMKGALYSGSGAASSSKPTTPATSSGTKGGY